MVKIGCLEAHRIAYLDSALFCHVYDPDSRLATSTLKEGLVLCWIFVLLVGSLFIFSFSLSLFLCVFLFLTERGGESWPRVVKL